MANFFSVLVFSSIFVLLLNFVISIAIVYFAAKILLIPGNTFYKAFLVVLAGFIIGFLQDIFFPVTLFFSWIAALVGFLWAIKTIYQIEYAQAFFLWIVSIILPLLLAILVAPWLVSIIYTFIY